MIFSSSTELINLDDIDRHLADLQKNLHIIRKLVHAIFVSDYSVAIYMYMTAT